MDTNLSKDIQKVKESKLFRWDWRAFVLVAISAVPIPFVAFYELHLAFSMVIGLIPAAFAGVGPTRKSRSSILVLGVLIPASLIIGSILSSYTNMWIAASVLALLGISSALMMVRGKYIWLNMIAPVIAVGLSFTDVQTTLGFAAIMIVQSILAFVVSLVFPKRTPPQARETPKVPRPEAWTFGVLFGLALFTATAISWGWDHMGWVVGSTGLVMRPSENMQKFRSVWRAASILVGLIIVSAFLLVQPSPTFAILFTMAVMAVCAGLNKSRAYIMPLFMTICVFMLIEYPITGINEVFDRFVQRLSEVGLGIIVALIFGLAIPVIVSLVQKMRSGR